MCVVVPHILARGTRWRVPRCIPSGRPALSHTHLSALLNTGVFRWQSFRAGPRRMTTYRRCTTRKGEFLLPLQSHDRGELSRSPGPHRPTLRGLDAVRGFSLPLNPRQTVCRLDAHHFNRRSISETTIQIFHPVPCRVEPPTGVRARSQPETLSTHDWPTDRLLDFHRSKAVQATRPLFALWLLSSRSKI